MEELTARLDRLEWANRRLSWLVSAAMVGVVLLGLLDFVAPKSSSVEGRRFIVKDETGRVRAILGDADWFARGGNVAKETDRETKLWSFSL